MNHKWRRKFFGQIFGQFLAHNDLFPGLFWYKETYQHRPEKDKEKRLKIHQIGPEMEQQG